MPCRFSDYDLVEGDQEYLQFLIEPGVTRGTARPIVRAIDKWINEVSQDLSLERNSQDSSDDNAP
jgi:hypothetical protein